MTNELKNNNNGFVALSVESVIKSYQKDSAIRKANKSSNDVVINLLKRCDSKAIIKAELTKGGSILNRGSVCECAIKLLFKNQKTASKYGAGRCDMVLNGVDYEIKTITSKGYATYNPNQNYDNVIVVMSSGVYLCNKKHFILDNTKTHIKTIKIDREVKTLIQF